METAVYSRSEVPTRNQAAEFTTTHWSLILAAGETSSPRSVAALEDLCRTYWYPLYAYVRRKGHSPEDAEDLVQDFFARLLEKRYLANADRGRGKFRSFLLTSLQHFLVNEWKKLQANKRGGGAWCVSWDEEQTESRYLAEHAEAYTPEKLFEKRWAMALLDQVLLRLKAEYAEAGKETQFERLKAVLWGEKTDLPYAELGAQLGLSEAALKVAVHRMRQRYRNLLREEVARTVGSPTEVDNELRHLISVVSN